MLILILTLTDGSALRLDVDKAYVFEVKTKYGTLSIPATDILSADLGSHCDDAGLMRQYAENLGSKDYKKRDEATSYFKSHYREAYPFFKNLLKDKDLEKSRRAKTILASGEAPKELDEFTLSNSSMQGLWSAKTISGTNKALGKMTVRVSQISSVAIVPKPVSLSLTLEDGWKELGFVNNKCNVLAEGQVDMWPQNGGTWIAGPGGSQQNTMHEGYPAGALLGRMAGRVFLIGADFKADNLGRGVLEVKINGAPWSQHFEGEFKVTLK